MTIAKRFHLLSGIVLCIPLLFYGSTGILAGLGEQIERIIYPDLFSVAHSNNKQLTAREIQEKLQHQYGQNIKVLPRSLELDSYQAIVTIDKINTQLWVNPYNGDILGEIAVDQRLSRVFFYIHSLDFGGWFLIVLPLFLLALLSGMITSRFEGSFRPHSLSMLISSPFVLWQICTAIAIGWLPASLWITLHNPPTLALRLLFICAMVILLFGISSQLFKRLSDVIFTRGEA